MAGRLSPLIVGCSPLLQRVLELAVLYAPIDEPVLLLGPTGVGKGLVAKLMHEASGRPGEFVAVSGGQLVESLLHSQLFGHEKGAYTGADRRVAGAFERARGGTLLVDELQLIPQSAQGALLQPTGEGQLLRLGAERDTKVTARLLFASNRPLDELEAEGRLMPDLRYRLYDFVIEIPPLVERRVDIVVLAYHFLDRTRAAAPERTPAMFHPEAIDRLLEFDWPGNVRQLKGAVAYACVHAAGEEQISTRHLPAYLAAGPCRQPLLDVTDRSQLTQWAFERAGGDRRAAARLLGVHPNTIDYRRKRWGAGRVEECSG
ncbi:MAG TPA: sigma 54-interacting transcriptional regulator [Gemmatimonadales bacterium]|nr:sigma 54-interacting transcriptional regulator [Gemmatimonadales bacterium]